MIINNTSELDMKIQDDCFHTIALLYDKLNKQEKALDYY
jgi:hypothetical protein